MSARVQVAPVAPWDQGAPALHGPEIWGASPGKPFFYAVPATGERPLAFAAEGLPEGLRLDPATGRLSGRAAFEGDARVLVRAENRHGRAERELVLAFGRGLALTPPLGWNSWNAWRRWVDDGKVRAAAGELVRRGLAARGYQYVNVDSCWQGVRGGPHQAIQPNGKFPDLRALADFLHARGLKFGLYSTPWAAPWGCSPAEAAADWGGPPLIGCSSGPPDPDYAVQSLAEGRYVGRDKHEAADVAQWVAWEVDFLKYDWCPTDPASLERMGRLLKAAERDIVLSVCTEARIAHAAAFRTWAHLWRGIPDTADTWPSVLQNAFFAEDCRQEDWRPHVGPGGWHDLDMLALGPQFHTAAASRPNRLSSDEQLAHLTAWALHPSPLLLSCDLSALSDFELRLFANEEVLAVNQDRLGVPATRVAEERRQAPGHPAPWRNARILARPLADGDHAVGFFNLADRDDELTLDLAALGRTGSTAARNLWERRDLGRAGDRLAIAVPAHGAQLLRVGA